MSEAVSPEGQGVLERVRAVSPKIAPVAIILLGIGFTLGGIAFQVTRDFALALDVMDKLPTLLSLVANPALLTITTFSTIVHYNVVTSAVPLARVAFLSFSIAGVMMIIYGVLSYIPPASWKGWLRHFSVVVGMLFGSIYILTLSFAGLQLSQSWIYDNFITLQNAVTTQDWATLLTLKLSPGHWMYTLLVAGFLLLLLTIVTLVFPKLEATFRRSVYPLATLAVWLLAYTEWTKIPLMTITSTLMIFQFATSILPESLFMGASQIEGAALIILGVGLLLMVFVPEERVDLRYIFAGMAAGTYSLSLIYQLLGLLQVQLTVVVTPLLNIALVTNVIAGIIILIAVSMLFYDLAKRFEVVPSQ